MGTRPESLCYPTSYGGVDYFLEQGGTSIQVIGTDDMGGDIWTRYEVADWVGSAPNLLLGQLVIELCQLLNEVQERGLPVPMHNTSIS